MRATHVMTPRAVQQLERWMTPRHPIKERLMARIDGHRQSLLEGVQRARDELLADLLASAGMRDATAVMARIADQVGVYARSCDWALLDLIVLASCVRVDPRALARDLAPPLLIYQAYRMVDDKDCDGNAPTTTTTTTAGTPPAWGCCGSILTRPKPPQPSTF